MPNIQSAKKRVQVSERNRLRNMAIRSAVRTAVKKAMLAAKSQSGAVEASQAAYSVIDRAIVKGVLHKNTGARYKSRLMKAAQASK